MKKLFILCFVSALAVAGYAQKPAVLSFDKTELDYGTLENGAPGEREFVFKNLGGEALVITTCRGSCGCTVPKCPTEPIMPGQSSVIKVNYDTKRTGAFTKTVTVESNDPSGAKVLKISGEIKAPATEAAPTNNPGH